MLVAFKQQITHYYPKLYIYICVCVFFFPVFVLHVIQMMRDFFVWHFNPESEMIALEGRSK